MSEPLRVKDRRPEPGDKIVSETIAVMISNAVELADEVINANEKGLLLRGCGGNVWALSWPMAHTAVYVHRADGGSLERPVVV